MFYKILFKKFKTVTHNNAFLHKVNSSKALPIFTGDPLDWARFKQAYDNSTQNFQIPNQENIARLFEALKGEARETVKTLFASGSNSNDIMRTLELRFGNSKMILEKIISEFSNLPAIGSGKISLLEFASKLKNAVTSLNL